MTPLNPLASRASHSGSHPIFAGSLPSQRHLAALLRRLIGAKLWVLGWFGIPDPRSACRTWAVGYENQCRKAVAGRFASVNLQPKTAKPDRLPGQRKGWKLFVAMALLSVIPQSFAGEIRLAIANSTCNVLKKVGELYSNKVDHQAQFTYTCKSSGLIAKGLSGGLLSADIFVSADKEWMDFAVENKLVSEKEVVSPWGNVLVVAVPAGIPLELRDITEITSSKVSSLMIGDPGTAPFGRYAKQALESAGLWEQVQNKVTTRKNIDLLVDALAEAESGTVGILFKSNMNERLREVAAVKASLHPPIRYYLAPLDASAARADIQKFLKFLTGPLGKAVFRAQNFDVNP